MSSTIPICASNSVVSAVPIQTTTSRSHAAAPCRPGRRRRRHGMDHGAALSLFGTVGVAALQSRPAHACPARPGEPAPKSASRDPRGYRPPSRPSPKPARSQRSRHHAQHRAVDVGPEANPDRCKPEASRSARRPATQRIASTPPVLSIGGHQFVDRRSADRRVDDRGRLPW